MKNFKLTQYSHGSGCGCKVAPSVLEEMLRPTGPGFRSANLLVGNDTNDDAAVYDIGNGQALISTVDFFTPVVDNAFDYGKIAAANALSDVYAMGGKPFMAIAVLGWPVEKLPAALAQEVIKGAKSICTEAEVVMAGGHTIDAPEPFFGLSVNGTVLTTHLKRNSTAREGDLLFLTKAIGTGQLSTAVKRGLLTEEAIQQAVDSMCHLNSLGVVLGQHDYVHAMTDVTGFGLLGHLIEMCQPAGLSAEITYAAVPLLNGVKDLAAKFVYADNTMRNWKSYEDKVQGIGSESLLTLCDPQTNGGLLVAIDPAGESAFKTLCNHAGEPAHCIGRLVACKEKIIHII